MRLSQDKQVKQVGLMKLIQCLGLLITQMFTSFITTIAIATVILTPISLGVDAIHYISRYTGENTASASAAVIEKNENDTSIQVQFQDQNSLVHTAYINVNSRHYHAVVVGEKIGVRYRRNDTQDVVAQISFLSLDPLRFAFIAIAIPVGVGSGLAHTYLLKFWKKTECRTKFLDMISRTKK